MRIREPPPSGVCAASSRGGDGMEVVLTLTECRTDFGSGLEMPLNLPLDPAP